MKVLVFDCLVFLTKLRIYLYAIDFNSLEKTITRKGAILNLGPPKSGSLTDGVGHGFKSIVFRNILNLGLQDNQILVKFVLCNQHYHER